MHTLFCGMPSCYCSIRQTNKKITCFVFFNKMVPDWNTVCILWRLHSLYCFFMILHAHFIACENGCPLSWKTFFTADVLAGNKWKAVGAVNNINPQTHGSFSQYYFISSSDPRHVWGRYKPYNKSEPLATFSEFRIKQWVSHSGKF